MQPPGAGDGDGATSGARIHTMETARDPPGERRRRRDLLVKRSRERGEDEVVTERKRNRAAARACRPTAEENASGGGGYENRSRVGNSSDTMLDFKREERNGG